MPISNLALSLSVQGTLTKALDLASVASPLQFGKSIALANGVGANQADKIFHDIRTINASSNDDLDLAGVLVDAVGDALTFVKVKMIVVVADSANVNNVIVGGAGATQMVGPFGANTHTVAVAPGGLFAVARADATGWAVGAGATDIFRVTNGGAGTSVTYSIVIVGTSA